MQEDYSYCTEISCQFFRKSNGGSIRIRNVSKKNGVACINNSDNWCMTKIPIKS